MSSVKFKLDNDRIVPSLTKTEKDIVPIIKDGYTFYKAHTPIRSGNARKNTRLNNSIIQANYAYAARLEAGYSNQAPDGMTKPTISYLNKRFDKLFKGK